MKTSQNKFEHFCYCINRAGTLSGVQSLARQLDRKYMDGHFNDQEWRELSHKIKARLRDFNGYYI